ncbi:MAG: hypothetical protein ACR2QM_15455 [Longimicrobiales bacterium]
MKKKDLLDALGTLGMIAGLVFVGAEIRQGTVATRAATVQQVKDNWLDFNLTVASSPELATAFQKGKAEGWNALSPGEQLMMTSFYRSLFHNWSNAYSQLLLGTLEDDQWLPNLRDAAPIASDSVGLEVWRRFNHVYDDRFRTLMDSLIAVGR